MRKRPPKASRVLANGMEVGMLNFRFLYNYGGGRPLARYIDIAGEATPNIGHHDEGTSREGR